MEKALATPDRFVLKPQREGGGNNVYGKSDTGEIDKLTVHLKHELLFLYLCKMFSVR